MSKLEDDFKQEIWKHHKLALRKKRGVEDDDAVNLDDDDPNDLHVIPADLLINESVNAKLF